MTHIRVNGNRERDLVSKGFRVNLCLSHLAGGINDLLRDIQLSGLAVGGSNLGHILDVFNTGDISLRISDKGNILESAIDHHRMVQNRFQFKVPVDVVLSHIVIVTGLNNVILYTPISYNFTVFYGDTHILSSSEGNHCARCDRKDIVPVVCCTVPAQRFFNIVVFTGCCGISGVLSDITLKCACRIRLPDMQCNFVLRRDAIRRIVLIQEVSDLVRAQVGVPDLDQRQRLAGQSNRIGVGKLFCRLLCICCCLVSLVIRDRINRVIVDFLLPVGQNGVLTICIRSPQCGYNLIIACCSCFDSELINQFLFDLV